MKKIFLTIFLISCLLVSGIGVYIFLQQDNEKTNVKSDNTEKKAYTNVEEYTGIGGLQINYDSSKLVYNGTKINFYFSFDFNKTVGKIKEISATYSLDNNLEYIDMTVAKDSGWNLNKKGNKITLTTNNPVSKLDNFYYIHAKIKDNVTSDTLSIWLRDIIIVNTEGKMFSIKDCTEVAYLNKRENYKYEHDETLDLFNFYKYDVTKNQYTKIGKYECNAVSCFPYATQNLSFIDNFSGNMIVVKEINNSMFFDLVNYEKGVVGTYKEIYYGMYVRGDFGGLTYLIVETLKGEKKIISPYSGEFIADITEYEVNPNMRYSIANRFYSVEKSRLVVVKNDKWGVIDITSGKQIVELKYQDIKIFDDYRYAAKENDKWYFYEFENNKKMQETGYDEILHIDSKLMIVQEGKYVYIKNLAGNNLIEEKIETFVKYDEFACCAAQNGIRIKVDGSIVDIYVDTKPDEDYNYTVYHYQYNGMKNTLKKIA